MSRLGQRLLFVLLVAAGGAAIAWHVRIDTWLTSERASATTMERCFAGLHGLVGNLKAAQASYLVNSQDPTYWVSVTGGLFAQLDEAITRQSSETLAPAAKTHYDAASALLGDLNQVDRRARDYVSSEQSFLASDVIFVESPALLRRFGSTIDLARGEEAAAKEARIAWLAQMQLFADAGAFVIVIGIGFVLLRLASRGTAGPEMTTESVGVSLQPSASPGPAADVPLQPILPAASLALPLSPPSTSTTVPPITPINFGDVADLCIDFSRLTSGDEMPGLLERSSKVLHAKGLVLWVIDTSGTMLRPLLGHGYSDKVMQRLGGLQVDADNVTSLAYRSAEAQVIGGRPTEYGALAVPLVTPTGCIGVLSAGTKRGRPDRETVAAAKMIAAQMATLAAPMDGRSERAAR